LSKIETLLAGGISLAGVGLCLVGSSVGFIRRHVRAEAVAGDVAAREIDRAAARFAGEQPLREIRDGQVPLRGGVRNTSPRRARGLHALISDVASTRIVRVDVPLSLLRVAKRGGFRYLGELTPLLEDTEFETDRVDVSLGELDRPKLVVDHAHEDGARILMWVE
jgi:hypothetical protein